RGDHDVNEAKLRRVAEQRFGIFDIAMKDDAATRENWCIGFCSPSAAMQNRDAVLIVDPDAAQGGFWASGANETDYHVKYFNWFRECGQNLADPKKVLIADIRNVIEGDPSPRSDGGKLKLSRGIEIGHVFKLGTKYSEAMEANFLDDAGQ